LSNNPLSSSGDRTLRAAAVARLRRAAPAALAVLLLGAVAWYLAAHWSELGPVLGRLDWRLWVGVGLLRLIAVVCAVAAGRALLRPHLPRLGFGEYFLVSTAGLYAAFVSPAGATLSKGVYLRQRHGLPLLHFGGLQVTLLLCLTGATSVAALIGLGLLSAQDSRDLGLLWAIALAGLACGLLPLLGRLGPVARLAEQVPRLRPALEVWRSSARPGFLARAVLPWAALRALVGFLALGALFVAFSGEPRAWLVGGTVDGITATLNLVRITPGNLGPYEWAVSLLGHWFALPLTAALAAALAYRFLALAAAGIMALGILALRRLRPALNTQSLTEAP
jgi:uncharacterized membrane protein YbhN (UPF0104 family)